MVEITRTQIAELMGINKPALDWRINTIADYNFPAPIRQFGSTLFYDEAEVIKFIKTNPFKKNFKRGPITARSKKLKEGFNFSGDKLNILLFLNPSLLNKKNRDYRLTYDQHS